MKRRELLKKAGLGAGALILGNRAMAAGKTTGGLILGDRAIAPSEQNPKRVLRVAHITDVHLKPDLGAPVRFAQCLEEIKTKNVDFFLNGGDTLHDTDPRTWSPRSKEYVEKAWDRWVTATQSIKDYEMYLAIGNHDVWLCAPNNHPLAALEGKALFLDKFGMPDRYYSFNKKKWHFIVLDSYNSDGSLDDAQRIWLAKDLAALPEKSPVVVLSHYAILSVATQIGGGNHWDSGIITDLFYQHRDKKIYCFSGHVHMQDHIEYNGVHYYCNGAMSGDWWNGPPGKDYTRQTPPGYAILDLYDDGTLVNEYIPHLY